MADAGAPTGPFSDSSWVPYSVGVTLKVRLNRVRNRLEDGMTTRMEITSTGRSEPASTSRVYSVSTNPRL